MLPLQDFFTSVLPDPCRKWILLPALLNFPCPETSDRAEPRSEMQGQHSHLKDQMLQTARAKNLKIRPGGDVEGVNALRILKLSGEEFSSYNVHGLLSHSRLPAQRVAHAEAAAMSWLRDSCGVQLAELQRRAPLLLQSEIWQLVGEYRARLVKLWTDCVEAAVQVEGRASGLDLPSGSLRRKAATVAQIPRSPWESMGNGGGGISWGGRGRAAVRLSAAAARLDFCYLLFEVSGLTAERAEDSMPLLIAGRTSLRLVARLGLSNFQLLQGLLAVVFLLHAADGAMLPGIFKALEEGLTGATPVSLGGIVFIEALCHSFAVLVWGVLADRHCKLTLLMYATLSWGLVTAATSFVTSVRVLCAVRALAGITGAAIGPLSQGLIGAVCPPLDRGRAFGWLIACGQSGFMLGVLLAGATSHLKAIHGWRGTFLLFGLLTRGLFQESRTWAQLSAAKKQGTPSGLPLHDIWKDFLFMLRRSSFWVLILQGAFASTTVKAMQYQIMWYQYLGFSDLVASSIACAAPFGSIFGSIAAGFISDWMAKHYPRHGRITYGQLMDFVKTVVLLYTFDHKLGSFTGESDSLSGEGGKRERVTPDTPNIFVTRSVLSFFFGFFSIMAYSAVVKPLFAEIVPAQMVAQVIALAAAIDGGFASIASTPVVGFITQHFFHYKSNTLPIKDMPADLRRGNAQALGQSIAWVTLTGSVVALVIFSFLHLTYPKDLRVSRRVEADSLPAVEDGDSSSDAVDEEGGLASQPAQPGKMVKKVSFDLGAQRRSSCAG
ncbi:unnamed protein product [Symbiodinium microadriaticum]|nr:unnamed protein product [Symbiodinium microadriaticum]